MNHRLLRRLLVLAVTLLAWLACVPAWAAPGPRPGGRLVVSLADGRAPPLVLVPGQGGWIGTLTVTNVGDEPLVVSRIAIRGDEDDPRSPSHLSVRFDDGAATTATLAPGASKDMTVAWMPDRDPRVHQAFGHVIVTSTDEAAGEVAIGFRAQLPTGFGWLGTHVLLLLVLLPLVAVVAVGVARAAGRRDDPLVTRTALAVAVVELLLALAAYARFVPGVGRADGNDGFQLVERFVWIRSIGAEIYLGVDGLSVALVPLAAALFLVALVLGRPDRGVDGYVASLALFASGATAVVVALDLCVFFVAWQIVLVAVVMLVGGGRTVGAERAAARLAVTSAIGSGAMLAAFAAMSRATGHTYLVDGTPVAHALSIPEIARTSLAARGPILGVPVLGACWFLLVVAVAASAPLLPLHGGLRDAIEEGPAGAGIVLAGFVTALGPYLLVRVGFGAMPEGARVAGGWVAVLGVVTAAYGALCAMAQHDLRGFVAYATISSSGATLFGAGSITTQGLEASVAGMVARGFGAALLLGVVAALERHGDTVAFERSEGIAARAPNLAAAVAVGLAVSLGVPCLVGFWGPFLAILGGFGKHPVLATLLAVALVASAAAHLRAARLLLLGDRRVPPAEPAASRDEGRDADPRELSALFAVAALALFLGLWPTPLFAAVASGARDAVDAVEPGVLVEP